MRGDRRQVKLRDRVPEHRLEVLRAQLDRQLREARPNFEWSVWINHGPTHHAGIVNLSRFRGVPAPKVGGIQSKRPQKTDLW